eukprot:scaffold7555_cov72-Cylindrotheca_fusiformis.AAC.2
MIFDILRSMDEKFGRQPGTTTTSGVFPTQTDDPNPRNPNLTIDPSTPPRMVRGSAMDTDEDDDLSVDSYYRGMTEEMDGHANSPKKIPPSGDQKRHQQASPSKRTLRSVNRKSARTHQQRDVTNTEENRSYSSGSQETQTVIGPIEIQHDESL